MTDSNKTEPTGWTRRDALKLSGWSLGGLALGGTLTDAVAGTAAVGESCADASCSCPPGPTCSWTDPAAAQRYTYFDKLPPFVPFSHHTRTTIAPLAENEMRITFMGSAIPPRTLAQRMMSIFVEVGWDPAKEMPLDQFVFDCGSGVGANYGAMNVGYGRMDKVFLTHLHGDHMSDLTTFYCFGPAGDRKSPLYVWGPGPSGVENPLASTGAGQPRFYDDGTRAFCAHLREACRWHTESFSFESTGHVGYRAPTRESWGLPCEPIPVGNDPKDDGYAMIPIELDLQAYAKGENVAYENKATGVKITFFPVIHTRKGSIGYKLEWRGRSMIYTGDTKPERLSLEAARNGGRGVDVFIHEMVVPAQVWAMKMKGMTDPSKVPGPLVQNLTVVQNSSHTPQGAFGYLLSQVEPRPRLMVATHFPTADDTVACAMKSVQEHCKVFQGNDPNPETGAARITWSFDRMVISVFPDRILEQRGEVQEFGFTATPQLPPGGLMALKTPKYHYADKFGVIAGNPYAQIDLSTGIPACNCDHTCNFREDGY
ncbi:hypothetical protein [uncultured Thiodictyon sp.]|uniref:hypothetical protein n=1 Tax=uncultured Thiodictyon sp. TaxID=1846217 RepID=UPI0025D9FEC6|nr:hypothetical protein [uncultured Thiodictyon sp.]